MNATRHAARRAMHRPALSGLIVALLAIGIGVNAVSFTVLRAVTSARLPYPESERLLSVALAPPSCALCSRQNVPTGLYAAFARATPSVEEWGAYEFVSRTLERDGVRSDAWGFAMDPGLLRLIGATTHAGTLLAESDSRTGGARRVLLRYEYWQRAFNGDPSLVGRFVMLDGVAFEVAGVLSRDVVAPDMSANDFIATPQALGISGRSSIVRVLARMRAGATTDRVTNELRQVYAGVEPVTGFRTDTPVVPSAMLLSKTLPLGSTIQLAIVQALALLVLVAACVNIAGLLLARVLAERHLVGLRVILGARTRDLLTMAAMDVVPLVLAGSALGLLLASGVLPFADAALGSLVPAWVRVEMNGTVVGVTMVAAAICAMLIAAIPAREMLRGDLRAVASEGSTQHSRGVAARQRQRTLVSLQLGLATTMLVMAGLLVLNYTRITASDARLERSGSMGGQFIVRGGGAAAPIHDAVLDRLRREPYVIGAQFRRGVRLGSPAGRDGNLVYVDGSSVPVAHDAAPVGGERVGPGFRERAPRMQEGRYFSEGEIRASAGDVIIVNRKAADALWPKQKAVGRRVRIEKLGEDGGWRTVIGVSPNAAVALRAAQAPDPDNASATFLIPGLGRDSVAQLYVATRGPADSFADTVARVVESVAPRSMEALRSSDAYTLRMHAEGRARTILIVVLSCVALVLSTVGVGALVAYGTTLRRREFGIRSAFGATSTTIARVVMRDALIMSSQGLALGAVGSIAVTYVLLPIVYYNARLFDVRITLGVMIAMCVVTVLASLAPAMRAARVEPAEVLRAE